MAHQDTRTTLEGLWVPSWSSGLLSLDDSPPPPRVRGWLCVCPWRRHFTSRSEGGSREMCGPKYQVFNWRSISTFKNKADSYIKSQNPNFFQESVQNMRKCLCKHPPRPAHFVTKGASLSCPPFLPRAPWRGRSHSGGRGQQEDVQYRQKRPPSPSSFPEAGDSHQSEGFEHTGRTRRA